MRWCRVEAQAPRPAQVAQAVTGEAVATGEDGRGRTSPTAGGGRVAIRERGDQTVAVRPSSGLLSSGRSGPRNRHKP
jgi:hypothetical protein